MPQQDKHRKQAEHNRGMLKFIDTHDSEDCFRDWYITVSYYTALHYFEAILPLVVPKINSRRKRTPFEEHYYDHGARLVAMTDAEFIDIYYPYSKLHKISKAAKYNEYDTPVFTKVLIAQYLADVKTECGKVERSHR
jgi:hypothetical protein